MSRPGAKRLRDLFHQASAIEDAAARAQFLQQVCQDDASLRQRLEELLTADQGAGPTPTPAPSADPLPGESVGSVIGRYKLMERIGEGGCGVVYVAEQQEPIKRKVALKIIKLGMDTRSVIARFEAERQALALMDHPNIAKVLDAGATETGRPYFVMELVGGIKITDYSEQNHLDIRQRLDLFIQVCRAVQHAHQKGIIHRDLKPSNVLVATQDGAPVPKVIDFGIAKATQGKLADETVFTAFEQFLGTPAYMSPEQTQVGGLDVDTRSDIYSLGVLLYELLTGKTPFDTKELLASGLEAMRRTIQEKEPPTPSTKLKQEAAARSGRSENSAIASLHSALHRDLDWIVMKCLEKDRARRYDTANGLAMDIARHLNDEPVLASPPSQCYRFQKFIQRNRASAIAAAIVTLTLVVGSFVSVRQAVLATRAQRQVQAEKVAKELERDKALQAAARSEQVARFLREMLEGVGPSKALGRDTTMLKEILDKTVERLGKELTNQPAIKIELLLTLAETYGDLSEYKLMQDMAQESLRLARATAGNASSATVKSLNLLGMAQDYLGHYPQAEATLREAYALWSHLDANEQGNIFSALHNLARALAEQSKLEEAIATYRQALEIAKKMAGPENPMVATCQCNLAEALISEGKFDEAQHLFQEALAIQRKSLGPENPSVALSLKGLAHSYLRQFKLSEAEEAIREALSIQRKMLGNEHADLISSLNALGEILLKQKKLPEAEKLNLEVLRLVRKTKGEEHPETANVLNNLAVILREEGKLDEAEKSFREALALQIRLSGEEHADVGDVLLGLATVLQLQNRLDEAEATARRSLAIMRNHFGDDHYQSARSLETLANILSLQGKLAESETAYRRVVSTWRKLWGEDHPDLARSLHRLARVLATEGKLVESESTSQEALTIVRKRFGGADPRVATVLTNLAGTLQKLNKLEASEDALREALTIQRKALSDSDPQTLQTLTNLASVLRKENKITESEQLYHDYPFELSSGRSPEDSSSLNPRKETSQ